MKKCLGKESAIVIIISTISSFLGILFIPICLLVLLNIIDYVSGICAAKYRNQKINSSIGRRGIYKKVFMLTVVGICGYFDYVLAFTISNTFGNCKLKFFIATIVCLWLSINECISILENCKDIGVKLPKWLFKISKNIRSKIDNIGDQKAEELKNDK